MSIAYSTLSDLPAVCAAILTTSHSCAQRRNSRRRRYTLLFHELDDIPLYNGDVEAAGVPPSVVHLRDGIRRADALLIATPEYNHGVNLQKMPISISTRSRNGSIKPCRLCP